MKVYVGLVEGGVGVICYQFDQLAANTSQLIHQSPNSVVQRGDKFLKFDFIFKFAVQIRVLLTYFSVVTNKIRAQTAIFSCASKRIR